MIEIEFKADSGYTYDIHVDYTYDHSPAIFAPDPYDSYDDESELDMFIAAINPSPSDEDREDIDDSWNGGYLYDQAADEAMDDFRRRI